MIGVLVRTAIGRMSVATAAVAAALVLAACGTSGTTASSGSAANSSAVATAAPESNPTGDIPDSQVFVPFTAPQHLFTVSVPEGWAQSTDGTATTFTDKLNSVRIETHPNPAAPTPDSALHEISTLQSSTPGYRFGAVSVVARKAGQAVLITYQTTSPPNPVTGKSGVDAVERYEFWRNGQEVILTLSGPVGADNVDPWRTITDSLQWL
ncbi:MAG: hypothetical protein JWR37_4290 [Mycobacterium sp.]|nr:hypothetical protein [Mycobacterium sp.]